MTYFIHRKISFSIIFFIFFLILIFPSFQFNAQPDMPIDKIEQKETQYHYNPVGKRDPFYSKLLEEDEGVPGSEKAFGLRKYELTEVNLVGIIWGSLGTKAVLETPEGKSYIIKQGTLIGKKGGIVKNITNRQIEIQEFTTDYLGNQIEKTSILRLQHKEKDI